MEGPRAGAQGHRERLKPVKGDPIARQPAALVLFFMCEGAMTIDITPIESDGQHWVSVNMDGHAMERRGPFPDADAAEVRARQFATICRSLFHGDWPMPTEINDGRNR